MTSDEIPNNSPSLGSTVAPIQTRHCAGTSFHTRRLELPNGKGWIEIRGEFNPFDLDEPQRRLISMVADWFAAFELQIGSQPQKDSLGSPVGADSDKTLRGDDQEKRWQEPGWVCLNCTFFNLAVRSSCRNCGLKRGDDLAKYTAGR